MALVLSREQRQKVQVIVLIIKMMQGTVHRRSVWQSLRSAQPLRTHGVVGKGGYVLSKPELTELQAFYFGPGLKLN